MENVIYEMNSAITLTLKEAVLFKNAGNFVVKKVNAIWMKTDLSYADVFNPKVCVKIFLSDKGIYRDSPQV